MSPGSWGILLGVVVAVFVLALLFFALKERFNSRAIDRALVQMYETSDRKELARRLEGRTMTLSQKAAFAVLTGKSGTQPHTFTNLGNSYLDKLLENKGIEH